MSLKTYFIRIIEVNRVVCLLLIRLIEVRDYTGNFTRIIEVTRVTRVVKITGFLGILCKDC